MVSSDISPLLIYLCISCYTKGPQGIIGETGLKGVQGDVGLRGHKGFKGDHGEIGEKGELGLQVSHISRIG